MAIQTFVWDEDAAGYMTVDPTNRKRPAMIDDGRLYAPAATRNRTVILDALKGVLPIDGLVLEIASGSGEHAVAIAETFPALRIQPSDPDKGARESIAAWIRATGLANIRPPLDLNASSERWPIAAADALICINMVHISPWAATEGLMRGAAQILPAGAPLYLYGPYRRDGAHTAESNARFDAQLRGTNPAWGVRDLEAVAEAACAVGFRGPDIIPMPANNFSLVFRR